MKSVINQLISLHHYTFNRFCSNLIVLNFTKPQNKNLGKVYISIYVLQIEYSYNYGHYTASLPFVPALLNLRI